jgi:hypothetical protein
VRNDNRARLLGWLTFGLPCRTQGVPARFWNRRAVLLRALPYPTGPCAVFEPARSYSYSVTGGPRRTQGVPARFLNRRAVTVALFQAFRPSALHAVHGLSASKKVFFIQKLFFRTFSFAKQFCCLEHPSLIEGVGVTTTVNTQVACFTVSLVSVTTSTVVSNSSIFKLKYGSHSPRLKLLGSQALVPSA